MKCSGCNQDIVMGEGFYKLPVDLFYCLACYDQRKTERNDMITEVLTETEDAPAKTINR